MNNNITTNNFYAYSWHVDESCRDSTFIRIYGFTKEEENVCVSINNFRPFLWVELPTYNIDWKDVGRKNLSAVINEFCALFPYDVKCSLKFRRKLYTANLKKKSGQQSYVYKMFPFFLCSFSSFRNRYNFITELKSKKHYLSSLGNNIRFKVHGQDACPRLQLTSKFDLPTVGWITFCGVEILNEQDKFTSCAREFLVDLLSCKKPKRCTEFLSVEVNPKPLILSFDLEVNSEDQITMPKATRPGDVVFQISCVFSRLGSGVYDKYLISLGNPKEEIVGAKILAFSKENDLLMEFRDLVNKMRPNVVIGYNIFNFDIPYLLDRTNYKSIFPEWSKQGFAKNECGEIKYNKWSSSAYKNQEFKFLDCEGILYIDLLPVVQRDFKLNDYKLKTVSTHFIGETKDDLNPKSIFLCYAEGIKDGEKASRYMSICGKYCMQDSMLVLKLLEKLNVWYGLSEMAVVCNLPMLDLFTKGQQIKVYSMLYKHCLQNDIVPEKDAYVTAENERYAGAYVFESKPGLYENVVPVDFCSLYPSLIIAYNIDYTTCVFDPSIPDDMCNVMQWEDHVGCKHDPKVVEKGELTTTINSLKSAGDKELVSKLIKRRSELTKSLSKNVMCEKRKYRFLKAGDEGRFKGVLPSIVQYLLNARKETRSEMRKLRERLGKEGGDKNIETALSILNQRQLAYKISANSMYGITGVKAGMLPFMPVAMSITYMGRTNIMKVADIIRSKYKGEIIAGDTDSNYVCFNHRKFKMSELWDYAVKMAEEISLEFPAPMKLEFEEAVYTKFLILTKKRYIYQTALKDGSVKPEIGKRGVLLNRRDNSAFIRNTYENIVKIIFGEGEKEGIKQAVMDSVVSDVSSMFSQQLPLDNFVITKSTGDYGDLKAQYFRNEKGVDRAMLGQYNVPFLTDSVRVEEGIETDEQETDWYLEKLPAHIQLLEKIKRRGHIGNEGSRLEYVILETNNPKDKQSAKIETANYYRSNRDVLKIDYLYYLKRLVNPVDQLLEVIFGLGDFMKKQYKYHSLKKKLTSEIYMLDAPKFHIETNRIYILRFEDTQRNHYYRLVYGDKQKCEQIYNSHAANNACCLVSRLDYVPVIHDLYNHLQAKYGPSTSLKTQFLFRDNYIFLNNMTESKLVSTIRREFCSTSSGRRLD